MSEKSNVTRTEYDINNVSLKEYNVSLKEYFEHKLVDAEDKVNLKIDSLKEATILARESMDERLGKMNEFRDALKDQNQTFLTKSEHDAYLKYMNDQHIATGKELADLKKSRDEAAGKASQSQVMIASVIAIVGTTIAVISLMLRLLGM